MRRRSLLGVLGSALAAIHVVCCSTEQPTQRCSSNDCCLEYPHAADGSTALVRELLQPFSLEDFAEKFWERMPLVIRGRCVSARRFISYVWYKDYTKGQPAWCGGFETMHQLLLCDSTRQQGNNGQLTCSRYTITFMMCGDLVGRQRHLHVQIMRTRYVRGLKCGRLKQWTEHCLHLCLP